MATDALDEHRFASQCTLYDQNNHALSSDTKRYSRPEPIRTQYEPKSSPIINYTQRTKHIIPVDSSSNLTPPNSTYRQYSVSNDLLSRIRSVARKPFKASSMTNVSGEEQTSGVTGGSIVHAKEPVSLLKYRPLSDNVNEHTFYTQSIRVCI